MKFTYETSTSTKETYKSAWAAFLWSIAIPGFGQFYNRDYFLGIVLITWEIIINLKADINDMVLYSFRGQLHKAYEAVDLYWVMFYPSIFVYSSWQAYNKARSLNYQKRIEGEESLYRPEFTFFSVGMVVGANLGIYYPFLVSPLFSGLVFGFVLGFSGHKIEKHVLNERNIEDE